MRTPAVRASALPIAAALAALFDRNVQLVYALNDALPRLRRVKDQLAVLRPMAPSTSRRLSGAT